MTPELATSAALLAGFFGSTHCIAMCGAIVVLLETPAAVARSPHPWLRRGMYNAGRLCFYVLLGSIAGLGGSIFTRAAGLGAGLHLLRVLAALLVVAIGLNLLLDLRLTRFLETAGAGLWQQMSRLAKYVLPANTPGRALAAGFLWGALPCGLVYSAVAMAATTGTPQHGAAVMLAFWLGTAPALLAAGASAERLRRWRANRTLRRAAGLVIVLLGMAAVGSLAMPAKHAGHGGAALSNLTAHRMSTRL